MAHAGLFGDLFYADADYIHEVGTWACPGSWQEKWLLNRRGPTYVTHPLGTVLDWLDDRLVTVSCRGSGPHAAAHRNNDDRCVLLGQTSRGALVSIRHDLVSSRPVADSYAGLQGTLGAYEAPRYPGEQHRVCLASQGRPGRRQWQPLADLETDFIPEDWQRLDASQGATHSGSTELMLRSFLNCILQDAEPRIDVYRALDFTVPGIVAEISLAEGGAPVAVPDFRLV